MKAQMQKGFTLIELMIVVAIIGILAAVALPAYQDYTKRAHVSEGIVLAAGAKTAVTEYYSSEAKWPTSNAMAGLPTDTAIKGNAVTKVAIGANGIITVTYNEKVSKEATDIIFTPTASEEGGSIEWACNKGSVDNKYRPANCRKS
ncbi:MAG: prepilin-type N-terminal cleavage/methylation domain-containing protein [Gammaproteobacteria bacterium]|nr:prepilin-type N-terminal cleavage/methylation domain-containing protein [Gammaproteobacteria bacterium]